MKSLRHQRGVSALGVLLVVAMFGFLLMCSMRLVPTYLEGNGVRSAIEHVLEDPNIRSMSLREIRRKLEGSFNMNQIDALPAREIIIKRDGDQIMVDATFEKRVNLFANIDAVVMHQNLVWEFTRE